MTDINELDIEKIVSKINVKRIEQMFLDTREMCNLSIDEILDLHLYECCDPLLRAEEYLNGDIWNKLFKVVDDLGYFEPIRKELKNLNKI
jgi:hypothetical protein